MDTAILDETVRISYNTYPLGEIISLIILPPAMSKKEVPLTFEWKPVHEKENSVTKPIKLRL